MTEEQKLFVETATRILVARIGSGDGLPKEEYLAYRAVAHAKVIMAKMPQSEDPTP